MQALTADFYERPVLEVARDLIGCTVEHAGSSAMIVETEAYHDSEPACHAHIGVTPRTRTLFEAPGRAYVYLAYGVHTLFNAVCEPEGIGAAVLIRAAQPLTGLEQMRVRREAHGARIDSERDLCSGPGKLTQALALRLSHNGGSLSDGPVQIFERGLGWTASTVTASQRVGIRRAVELPWRFCVAGNSYVSPPRIASAADVATVA